MVRPHISVALTFSNHRTFQSRWIPFQHPLQRLILRAVASLRASSLATSICTHTAGGNHIVTAVEVRSQPW